MDVLELVWLLITMLAAGDLAEAADARLVDLGTGRLSEFTRDVVAD